MDLLHSNYSIAFTKLSVPQSLSLAPYASRWGSTLVPFLLALLAISSIRIIFSKSSSSRNLNRPPIVPLSNEEIFENPQQSYEEALKKYGSVIGVRRKGRLEYIVSGEHTRQVLTEDKIFSFELGVAKILNIKFLLKLCRGTFFKDMDHLVNSTIIENLPIITEQVYPIFRQNAERLISRDSNAPIDAFHFAHETIAQAMIVLIFGEENITPENQEIVIEAASGIAELTGMFQNQAWFARTFPFIWRISAWFKIIVYKIGFKFMKKMGLFILKDLGRQAKLSKEIDHVEGNITVMSTLARENARSDGSLPILTRIWILSLLLGLMFASVHQTATVIVWVLFELAKRPEHLPALKEELDNLFECDRSSGVPVSITYEDLRSARYLDSFIREVMRTKGDTLSTVRITTTDVPLGGYVIPKGYPVIPLATLSHNAPEYNGRKTSEYDGFRWVDEEKSASMTGPGYLAFGLGRWACPGRMLAVAEIKMIVLTLIASSTPVLEGDDYRIVDKLNITSVPPEGEFKLLPRIS